MFQHAAEYGASQIGIMGSLRDIYDYFIQIGFTPHLAWQRAARHKFGFTDTSRPGDFLKPATYFAYEQKVKELDKDELWRLFCGKITIADLRKYPDYAGLIPLEKLKQFYLISSFELT